MKKISLNLLKNIVLNYKISIKYIFSIFIILNIFRIGVINICLLFAVFLGGAIMDTNCKEYNEYNECMDYLDFSNISIFLAYNVNVDAIKYYKDGKEIQNLIEKYGEYRIIEKYNEYPRKICNPIDYIARLIHAMINGKPAEVPLLDDENLNKWFDDLKYDEERMGGQVGIIANLLSILRTKKVIAYSPILSKKQAEMFVDNDNLVYPSIIDGNLMLKKPIESYKENDPLKINRIFEYKEGIKFKLGDKRIITPIANRFIVASRPDKLRLEIKEDLKEKLPEIGEQIDCAIFSGYQGIKEKYSDGKTYKYYFTKAEEDLDLLRQKNKNIKIHLEFASIQNINLRKNIINRILPKMDCLGMDETEVANLISTMGYEELGEKIIKYSKMEDAIEASKIIMETYPNLELLQVHTLYYIMVICKKDNPLTIEQFKRILELATILAATKAKLGEISKVSDLLNGLTVPHNKYGELFKSIVGNVQKEESYKDYKIVAMPSRLVDIPKSTVGLGDTISSSAFVGYVSLLKEMD